MTLTTESSNLKSRFSGRIETAKKYFNPLNGTYNVKALCTALTVNRKELLQYLGSNSNSIWTGEFAGINGYEKQEKVEKLLMLLLLLEESFSSQLDGHYWLRLPNENFQNKPPIKSVIEGNIDKVLDALIALADGNVMA